MTLACFLIETHEVIACDSSWQRTSQPGQQSTNPIHTSSNKSSSRLLGRRRKNRSEATNIAHHLEAGEHNLHGSGLVRHKAGDQVHADCLAAGTDGQG